MPSFSTFNDWVWMYGPPWLMDRPNVLNYDWCYLTATPLDAHPSRSLALRAAAIAFVGLDDGVKREILNSVKEVMA